MTTGGGWRDQIGGVTDGVKLITTALVWCLMRSSNTCPARSSNRPRMAARRFSTTRASRGWQRTSWSRWWDVASIAIGRR